MIAHCQFLAPNGEDAFDERLARRIADLGVYINPTLQINRVLLTDRVPRETLDVERRAALAAWTERYPRFAENVVRLRNLGVRLICGSDCGWGFSTFDETYLELDALVEAGLTPVETLVAATGTAADALGLEDRIGTVRPGQVADLLVVSGDPTVDVRVLRQVRAVWSAGQRIGMESGGERPRTTQSGVQRSRNTG